MINVTYEKMRGKPELTRIVMKVNNKIFRVSTTLTDIKSIDDIKLHFKSWFDDAEEAINKC